MLRWLTGGGGGNGVAGSGVTGWIWIYDNFSNDIVDNA